MANILLTERCVRSCPYCFAKQHMEDSEESVISWDNFIYLIDLHEFSKENISLLGGEPTIHPSFIDFTKYAIKRGLHVNVFTSGILAPNLLEKAADAFSDISPEQLSFVVNLNNPKISKAKETERIEDFLKKLGHFCSLGYNIYQTNFEMEFLFDYINRFALKRHLRLGLAHPIPGQINEFIKLEELRIVAERLLHYTAYFERFQIEPGFDCGFPMCVFTDEEIGRLYKIVKGRLSWGCGPAFDIGPDMMVWPCFPLSNFHKKSIYEFESLQEIRNYFEKMHGTVRGEGSGIYMECEYCCYKEMNFCAGGCISHIISKFDLESKKLRFQEAYLDTKTFD